MASQANASVMPSSAKTVFFQKTVPNSLIIIQKRKQKQGYTPPTKTCSHGVAHLGVPESDARASLPPNGLREARTTRQDAVPLSCNCSRRSRRRAASSRASEARRSRRRPPSTAASRPCRAPRGKGKVPTHDLSKVGYYILKHF